MKNKKLSKTSQKEVDRILNNKNFIRALVRYDYLVKHKNNIDNIYIDTFCLLFDLNYHCKLELKNHIKEYFGVLKWYISKKTKVNVDTIDDINNRLKKFTHQDNPVFSAKLLHIINQKMPVWDSVISRRDHFNIPRKYKDCKNNNYKELYKNYKKNLTNFTKCEGDYIVKQFRKKYKYFNITNEKIVDFVIWCDKTNKIKIPKEYKIVPNKVKSIK